MRQQRNLFIKLNSMHNNAAKNVNYHSSKSLAGLYAITDAAEEKTLTIIKGVEQALRGGAKIIQYRDKSHHHEQRLSVCSTIRELTRSFNALFIVNDDIQLVKAAHADGVHLGKDDTDLKQAREQLGPDVIIGVSCYNNFDLATQAAENGADYIAFGRFYPSRTKPEAVPATLDLLRQAKQHIKIPIAAIGGITAENGGVLIDAGADMLAVVDDVFGKPDIEAAAGRYRLLFSKK